VLHDFDGPWGLAWALGNPTALASLTLIDAGVLPDFLRQAIGPNGAP